jgi:hypothetical protein
MVFMSMTMLFVLSIPTLTTSRTGYTPVTAAFIRTDGSEQPPTLGVQLPSTAGSVPSPDLASALLPFSSTLEVLYVIHDGSRVGLTDNYPVPFVFSSGSHSRRGMCESCLKRMEMSNITDPGEPMIRDGGWLCASCTTSTKGDYACFRANVSDCETA